MGANDERFAVSSDQVARMSTPSPRPGKKKLAVLGGGPSVMSALFWITSTPELRERYDITVYQPVLFAAPSFDVLISDLGAYFDAL